MDLLPESRRFTRQWGADGPASSSADSWRSRSRESGCAARSARAACRDARRSASSCPTTHGWTGRSTRWPAGSPPITIASGVLGFALLIGLTALWSVVFVALHAARRAQDAQRRGDDLRRARVLPAAVPDAELRAARHAHAADGGR